ncbi:type II secretion system protein GspL [Paludibacterium paludis]|uniref:GspL periplasmic domain-containing protein n=1 Tax=Paludibacterium paludis TaxID=1225769 RepID=A0A918NX84_9NEIS|nr:type II secretion system protein GspL [Paludibacterium paludis]GGY04287.1 hypothetical protein GCM10011289_03480 [Paludibacterium paludis]
MNRIRTDLLRLRLPAAHAPGPFHGAWRLPSGQWQAARFDDPAAVAAGFQAKRLEVCPHPADVAMTGAELPPLSAKRLRLAVRGAVDLMALAPPDELAIGHGPRGETGSVPLAWMASAALADRLGDLARHGLRPAAVYPPPAFLPQPQDGAVSAAVVDGWMVVRAGPQTGILHPAPEGDCDARLRGLLPGMGDCRWYGADDPGAFNGNAWSWTLPTGRATPDVPWRRLRPLLGWGVAVMAVWLAGLNLYAARVEQEGVALKRNMAARVKSAFPELPVVLNPLQQARQMRDARKAGAGPVAAGDFAALLRASSALLSQSAAQVARLSYQGGQLEVRWREGASLKASELAALQAQARERGLAVDPDEGGLRIRAVPAEGTS